MNMTLPVTNIQRLSVHDGDGIRTTVFVKGCPLNCVWCHNPETKKTMQQIYFSPERCIECGACAEVCASGVHSFNEHHSFDAAKCNGCCRCTEVCPTNAVEAVSKNMKFDEILNVVLKDKAFYGSSGGITLSGGEPLMFPAECTALLDMAKKSGITTAVETSGYFDEVFLKPLAEVTDTFLWDYKDTNAERHKKNTGVSNERIIHNLMCLNKLQSKIILRCIMVKSINMDAEHIKGIANIYHKLKNSSGVELLPYHAFGGAKNKLLGYCDDGNKEWIPSDEDIDAIKQELCRNDVVIL